MKNLMILFTLVIGLASCGTQLTPAHEQADVRQQQPLENFIQRVDDPTFVKSIVGEAENVPSGNKINPLGGCIGYVWNNS